jgi:hypothetical protein
VGSCKPLRRGAQFAKEIRSHLKTLVAKTARRSRPHTDDTKIWSPTRKCIPYGDRSSLLWVPQKLTDYWFLKEDATCRVTLRTRRRVRYFPRKHKLGTKRHIGAQHLCARPCYLLRASKKSLKLTISFVMPVCLSVRPSVRANGTTWLPLDGISWNLILDTRIFRISPDKIRVLLKYEKNDGYLTCRRVYVYDSISLNSL